MFFVGPLQVEFVYNMARSDSLSCPFQVDACIAYNDAKMSDKTLAALPNDGDDDEDSDDEDEQKAFEFEDCAYSLSMLNGQI